MAWANHALSATNRELYMVDISGCRRGGIIAWNFIKGNEY